MGLITYENLEDGTPITANVFNERFAQIISQLNGNIDVNNIKNAGISKEKLQAEIYESIYPIGSMYVNFTDDTNPATLLGFGTWTAVAGRVVAGYDGTQTEFNAAEKTGGAKSNTHNHYMLSSNDGNTVYVTSSSSAPRSRVVSKNRRVASSSGSGTGNTREDSTYNETIATLPPYIVGYIWKRTS